MKSKALNFQLYLDHKHAFYLESKRILIRFLVHIEVVRKQHVSITVISDLASLVLTAP